MRKRMTLDAIKKEEERFHQPKDRVGEIIYDLQRSRLATLVVEGIDDETIYQRVRREIYKELESNVNDNNSQFPDLPYVNIERAGSKDSVLEVYEQRNKFEKLAAVVFMVDQDKWVYFGIPRRFQDDIICTKGYSIENDLYSDGEPETLIPSNKICGYYKKLKSAIQNWAHDVAVAAKDHPKNRCTELPELEERYEQQIVKNPTLKLRGKTLFEVLSSVCQARDHLELCMDVFSTINWHQDHPGLLSKLVWDIQSEIAAKQAEIPDRTFIRVPKKRS